MSETLTDSASVEAPEAVSTPAPTDAHATDATPVEATETPAPDAPAPEEPKADTPPPKKDWRETRIAQLTARNAALIREAEEARRLVEQSLKPADGEALRPGLVPETEIEKRAAALVQQREYQAKVQTFGDLGAKEFPDFIERCNTVAGLGLAPSDNPAFMQTIAEMPDGHRIVAHLAENPDEAMRIAGEPVHKMALNLAKISSSLAKPEQVSRAPAPITPVGGSVNSAPDIYDPKMPMEEWAKQFAKTTTLKGFRR